MWSRGCKSKYLHGPRNHIERNAGWEQESAILIGRNHVASAESNCRECWRLWKNEESSSPKKGSGYSSLANFGISECGSHLARFPSFSEDGNLGV